MTRPPPEPVPHRSLRRGGTGSKGQGPSTIHALASLGLGSGQRLPSHWSRYVSALDVHGEQRTWHVLDTHADVDASADRPTLVCVHGNPTWSYLWRRFLGAAPVGWRVVAVDQLGMGWSDRLTTARTLAERVDDLDTVVTALGVNGPVTVLAHDWGGPISLGWALRLVDRGERERLSGLVLANTAVRQPGTAAPPALIRLARSRVLHQGATVATPTFVRGATALSRPALPKPVRAGLAAPYRGARRRRAVGDFVADIPFEPDHPSRAFLDDIADGLVRLRDVPALILWGARDPVFTERHLADLVRRLPQADVQRYAHASHLVTEDVPATVSVAWRWIADRPPRPATSTDSGAPVLWAALDARAADTSPAVVELAAKRTTTVSFAELTRRIDDLAAGLAAAGVAPGDRVGLLVPPGIDLTAVVYACWRAGAVIVVSDAGLGVKALGNALRSAAPDHLVAIPAGLAAAKALRIPGRRILVGSARAPVRRALGAERTLAEVEELGRGRPAPAAADAPDDGDAAVLFTSGATGPPKGVVYRFPQLRHQLDQVRDLCSLTEDDRLVAAFAPFALYGPALGIPAAVPDMDVTEPSTLTAAALAAAAAAVDATIVFASPAALRNVVATADKLAPSQRSALRRVRLLLSAGAPVGRSLLAEVQQLLPHAELHTPYGMTEAMPVADTTWTEIRATGLGEGVLVGRPLPGVDVAVAAVRPDGTVADELSDQSWVTGEICVAAAHVKDHYDKLWAVEAESSRTPGWHRTGDVGHLDDAGRLWVEGRLAHIVVTAAGVVTPVAVEQRVEGLSEVTMAALVGVGPAGSQQVVVVVTTEAATRTVLADEALAAAVRTAAGAVPVAAVLVTDRLPVDIRHASKIDRPRVAHWAERVLAGGRVGRP